MPCRAFARAALGSELCERLGRRFRARLKRIKRDHCSEIEGLASAWSLLALENSILAASGPHLLLHFFVLGSLPTEPNMSHLGEALCVF